MQGITMLPVYLIDFLGATTMIVMSLVAFYYAYSLKTLEPKNVLWTYLFWLCMAMVALSVSRGIGHVLKYVFILAGIHDVWPFLAPFSGGLNTVAFISVAVLTFYYPNVRDVIELVQEEAQRLAEANRRLKEAHRELRILNQTLEQKVQERTKELQISESKFRGLFQGSKDLIFFCDPDGFITDINQSGAELLGYKDKNEVIGMQLRSFFSRTEDWETYYKAVCGILGHIKDFEVKFKKADGSTLYLMITANGLRNAQGNCQGSEAIAKDLTQYKRVLNQLIQSEKMVTVGHLAAGVAHEINTPLGIILGYTQLLEEDLCDIEDVCETLKIIEKQTKICKKIVAELLKFSRSTYEGERTEVDLNKCVEEVLGIIEHSLNMDVIYVMKNLEKDLPLISGMHDKICQVIMNLINNAHHALGKEGIIGIWTRYNADKKEVELIIADTGPGVPKELQGKIFDPFFTTKEVGKGTGLGLTLSYAIVSDHGGEMEMHSPPDDPILLKAGMETSFHVFLPVIKDDDNEQVS